MFFSYKQTKKVHLLKTYERNKLYIKTSFIAMHYLVPIIYWKILTMVIIFPTLLALNVFQILLNHASTAKESAQASGCFSEIPMMTETPSRSLTSKTLS